MPYSFLSSRRVLAISGVDAPVFLQGLFSCDVRPAFAGSMVYGALLSPQGKFLHDFFLTPFEGGVALDIDKTRAEDLFARLKMYRLRSQVQMDWRDDLHVVAGWDEAMPAGAFADPRLPEMGFRMLAAAGPEGAQPEEEYHHHRIILGVPDGACDMTADRSLLMEFGFEALHGVDFSKGCYVGQEVTARSKFRGQVRKSIYRVSAAGTLPEKGTKVMQGEREVGVLGSHSGHIGLALLQIEAVAADLPLVAGEVALEALPPAWLRND